MRLSLILILSVTSSLIFAGECIINAPRVIIWNKDYPTAKPSSALSFEGCNESFKDKVSNLINDFSGEVNNRVISTETGEKNFALISNFKVITLIDFLNQNINLPSDWKLINPKATAGSKGLITKNKNESFSVQCSLCQNTGEKTIKIEVVDAIKNRYRNHWVNAEVAVKTQALVSEENLKVDNTPLSPNQFTLKTLYSSKPERFFLSKDKVVFYKINKPINKGQMLSYSDLSPVDLVKVGRPVSVVLKNQSLTLEGSAIASQSGKLGERIRLKNNRTNKVIIGKIIDFNKAEVEL